MSRPVTDPGLGENPDASRQRHRRRRKLVDQSLQGRLLAALVALEMVMLGLAVFYLYLQFSAIIEENLYSIHNAQRALLPAFLKEMGSVILVMSVTNTLALLLAHRLWVQHIHGVTEAFGERLARIRCLDLRPFQNAKAPAHPVLQTAERWRQVEAQRLSQLGQELEQLPQPGPGGYTPQQRALLTERLQRCRQLLGMTNR